MSDALVTSATKPLYDNGATYGSKQAIASNVYPLNISLSTAGRIGFYVDYSELATTGTHKFYICRTHGTAGAVSVSYSSSGDAHTTVSGTLNWVDGDASIQEVEVVVPSKVAGDHRIYLSLSSPTGGAVLHRQEGTIAHGVIDDDTVATTNAIFIDADAVSNGDGTQGNPFNNWYSARDAIVANTRYIYIKGLLVPDATDSTAMSITVKHLKLSTTFSGRTSNSERLFIRGWPGFTGGIDGGGQTDVSGFACDTYDGGVTGSVDYITFRKLSGTNLNNADGGTTNGKAFFLYTRSSPTETLRYWTAEHINIDGVHAGANAACGVWYTEGQENQIGHFNLWRWTTANTTHLNTSYRLSIYESYRTEAPSIQRCTLGATAGGIFLKEGTRTTSTTGLTFRFNLQKNGHIRLSSQGGYAPQSYTCIQNNVFKSPTNEFDSKPLQFDATSDFSAHAQCLKHQYSNNIVYDLVFSTYAGLTVMNSGFEDMILFNNIYLGVDQPWDFEAVADLPEFVDYECYYYSGGSLEFNVGGTQYTSLASLQAGTSYAQNSINQDPLINDPINDDFTLNGASPCLSAGVGGSAQGVYFAGFEVIGA